MKNLKNKILKNNLVNSILAIVAAIYLLFIRITCKFHHKNSPQILNSWNGENPVIVSFWHNQLLMMPFSWKSKKSFHMLISKHNDGNIISKTVSWFGISTITGSTNKGGADATRKIIKNLNNGNSVGITPDGPRGPRQRASKGVLTIAQLSGATIIPLAASISKNSVLSTWDKLIIPLPFSSCVFLWGKPINIPRKISESELNKHIQFLESYMNELTIEVNKLTSMKTNN